MGRLWFVVFALAAASALPGAWRSWSAASAGRWSEFGDGVLFWITWQGDPGTRRLAQAFVLAIVLLAAAALAQHSARVWLAAPARWVHALCRPWPALAALALALLPHAVAPLARPDASGKPSVILVVLDSVRLDHVGWGGSELPTTPRLDALARGGAAFTQAITQAPWTKPSMATLHTGLTPSRAGATLRTDPLPPNRRTLAEAFAAAGYRTFGYSSNPNVSLPFRFDQGFQRFHEEIGAPADRLIERSRVEARPPNAELRPFFLYLHLNDTHYPYDPPAVSETGAGKQPIRGLFNRTGRAPLLNGQTEAEFRDGGGASFTDEDAEAMRLAYAEEIRWADDQVGDMIEKILAVRDDVLVVVASDHGEEFLEHGDVGHGHSLHEELMRVPLQFAWSAALGEKLGLRPGARGEQVRLLDVAPTLLELAGLSWPAAANPLGGRSLAPALRGEALPPAAAFGETDYQGSPLSGYAGPLRMLREPDAKIVISDPWFEETAGRTWLFDLRLDPAERVNAAEAQPELLRRLRGALDASGWIVQRDPAEFAEAVLSDRHQAAMKDMGYGGDNPTRPDPSKVKRSPRAVPWVQDPR